MRGPTILLSLLLWALVPAGIARADEPSLLTALSCDTAREPAAAPRTPSFDPAARELREYGHSLRLVGNKSHTRFPTHSYLAFTFDDGPSHKTTPRVLDALEKYDVPATFFVNAVHIVGEKEGTLKNIETLKEIVRRGFHVGNHTYHHRNLRKAPARSFVPEIERSATAVEQHLGYRPYLVRFPYGVIAQPLRDYLDQEGYVEVRWNIDSHDFAISNRARLRRETMEQIIDWNGGVVLFHDPKPWTAAEIGNILDDLEALNCKRLKTSEPLILPVSLHYYARERNGTPRPVPPEVEARTQRYVAGLPTRCKARIDKGSGSP